MACRMVGGRVGGVAGERRPDHDTTRLRHQEHHPSELGRRWGLGAWSRATPSEEPHQVLTWRGSDGPVHVTGSGWLQSKVVLRVSSVTLKASPLTKVPVMDALAR